MPTTRASSKAQSVDAGIPPTTTKVNQRQRLSTSTKVKKGRRRRVNPRDSEVALPSIKTNAGTMALETGLSEISGINTGGENAGLNGKLQQPKCHHGQENSSEFNKAHTGQQDNFPNTRSTSHEMDDLDYITKKYASSAGAGLEREGACRRAASELNSTGTEPLDIANKRPKKSTAFSSQKIDIQGFFAYAISSQTPWFVRSPDSEGWAPLVERKSSDMLRVNSGTATVDRDFGFAVMFWMSNRDDGLSVIPIRYTGGSEGQWKAWASNRGAMYNPFCVSEKDMVVLANGGSIEVNALM